MLKCYIEGRNLINGVEARYTISEGAVFTENYNETLDSGTIILPQLTSEIEIEPYDVVVIFTTDDSQIAINERRLCVDTYVCTQTSLDPAIYKYEISLFSETKILEGILLPSISITRNASHPKTILDYLYYYVYQYGPKQSFDGDSGPHVNLFSFASNVATMFDVECPEMQWNEPNLREVLNDLMMIKNCIVTLKNNVISYMDISSYGSEITLAQRRHINYIQKSQSSSDYTSELKTRIVNSVGDSEVTNICENITFRNNDTYILDTENVRVETSYPIWNLKSVKVYFKIYVEIYWSMDTYPKRYVWMDAVITLYDSNIKNILEYGEWQTKDIRYNDNWSDQPYSTDYQNTCLYYVRGQKGIHNFNGKVEGQTLWIPYSVTVLELIFNITKTNDYKYNILKPQIIEKYGGSPFLPDNNFYVNTTITTNMWKKTNFKVEYETLGEYTFLATKTNFTRHKRQVVDNQTNSYVNAKTFGFLEYMKANRLGNKINLINGRWDNLNESYLPELARKVNGSIIFRKEIAVYENYIKVNYQATDNYVLRDYFTGVKSKLRTWRIVDGSDAFLRADNIKFYINSNIQSVNGNSYIIPVYSTLQEYLNKFNYCCVRFNLDLTHSLPVATEMTYKGNSYDVDLYMLEFQKNIVGNSVVFSFKMTDNAIVGKYVNDDSFDVGNGTELMTQKNASYVDENGENEGGVIYFYENYSIEDKTDEDKEALHNLYPAVASSGSYSGLSNLVAKIPFEFRKDNKEITSITIQFELNENANNIYFGKN